MPELRHVYVVNPIDIAGGNITISDIVVDLPTGDCGDPNPEVLTVQGCTGMVPISIIGDITIPSPLDVNVVNQPISVIGDFSADVSVTFPTGPCGDPDPEVLTVQGCEGMTPISTTGNIINIVDVEIKDVDITIDVSVVNQISVGDCGVPSPDVLTVQGCPGMIPLDVTGLVSVVEPVDVNIVNEPISVIGDFASVPTGDCGDPNPQVLTIQGCAGMTPISVEGVEVNIGEISVTNLSVTLPTGTCGDPDPEVLTVQGCGGMNPISIIGNVGQDTTQGIDVQGVQQWEGDWVDGDNTLLWDTDLTGAGTATDDITESSRDMATTTASGDKVIVQARQRQLYLLGRTKRIIIGALIGAKKTDVRKRIGFFDSDDGVFFEQDGTDLKVVTRTSASGSPVDSPIVQASWNLDTLDGTGPSGITLDETKINFWIIEYDWHGAGKVKWGFRIGGSVVFVHEIDFANTITLPFIKRPTLPVRMSIENTGVTGSATTMKAYSASVINFSGLASLHLDHSADNTAAGTVVDTTRTPLVSIRLASGFEKNLLRVQGINLFTGSGNTIRWALIFNGSLTGASFGTVGATSIAEFDTTATAITGGVEIASGFFDNNNGVLASAGFFTLLFLSSNIAGTADIVTLIAQRASGVATINASMIFEEYKR